MRFITVEGSEPSRNPVIAVMISPASRPYRRGMAAAAPEWQPEQDAAPGGGSEAASTGKLDAMTVAIARRTQRFHLADLPKRSGGRIEAAARSCQAKGDVLVLQRYRTDALAGGREVGVEHRWRGDADGRLADAAPEAAARHHDAFHLRHLGDAHRVVGVEIGLLDLAILHRAAAVEQSGQAVDEGTRDLPLDLRRIDDIARSVEATMRCTLILLPSVTEISAAPRDSCRSPSPAQCRDRRLAAAACPSRSSRPRR